MNWAIKTMSTVVLTLLVCASVALCQIIVCPKCGYENPGDGAKCTHCEAELPGSDTKQPVETEPTDDAPVLSSEKQYLDAKIVRKEMRLGRQYFREGDIEIARLFFVNAACLEMLTDPKVESDRSERILQYEKKCGAGGGVARAECPVCGGSGKYIMDTALLDGETVHKEVPGRSCDRCKGKGYIFKAGSLEQRKYRIGRAVKQYTMLQHGKKFIPVGGAWVPGEIEADLSRREIVLLKRATAAPCPDCVGLGRETCRKCNGARKVDCPNSECENGIITVAKGGELVKGKINRTEKCKTCRGRGRVACATCRGRGSILCKKCGGSGVRPLCRKCGGQGLVPCRKCKGAGTYKGEPCVDCQGQRIAECSSCGGDGRKR